MARWLTFSYSPTCQLSDSSTSQLCHLPYLSVSLPVGSAMAPSLHLVVPLLVSFQSIPLLFCFAISPTCQFPLSVGSAMAPGLH
jgi:hypothetical protein